ncbi:MAG TPA: hypothetical protein PK668_20815 [Myxococcota bacterium]|nr:hypothetical protein [Myxococcota bacterium]HRY96646.1 hypothetical protein [Myxococcota bacterium]
MAEPPSLLSLAEDTGNIALAERLAGELRDPAERLRTLSRLADRHAGLSRAPRVLLAFIARERDASLLLESRLSLERPPDGPMMSDEFREALECGQQAAWALLQARTPGAEQHRRPSLHLRLELARATRIRLDEGSVGLAAGLLAFQVLSGLEPERTVVAAACLTAAGATMRCGHIGAKLEAYDRELLRFDALFLAAEDAGGGSERMRAVPDLATAVEVVFGEAARTARLLPEFLDAMSELEGIDHDIAALDHGRALARAEAVLAGPELSPVMRLRLGWRAARASLHLGRPDAATRYNALVAEARRLVGQGLLRHEDALLQRTEAAIALLDQFEINPAISELEAVLREATLVESRVHAQGGLAQARCMSGDADLAVQLREANLSLQRDAGLPEVGQSMGRTWCNLGWEAFLAGDEDRARRAADGADRAVERSEAERSQAVWNGYTRARIELFSGHPAVACAIVERHSDVLVQTDYPGIMLAVVRGAARCEEGDFTAAVDLLSAARRTCTGGPLIAWLAHLGLGWEILAASEIGEDELASELTAETLAILSPDSARAIMPAASRHFWKLAPLGVTPEQVACGLRYWMASSWY